MYKNTDEAITSPIKALRPKSSFQNLDLESVINKLEIEPLKANELDTPLSFLVKNYVNQKLRSKY